MPAAPPPDVRKASGFPSCLNLIRGSAPAVGAARPELDGAIRKGKAFPHIRRRSRSREF